MLTQPARSSDSIGKSSEAGPLLRIHSVAKCFGARQVLQDISLDVARAEFLTILGESGSGKTTLLRLIAGFEQPNTGEIWLAGERIDRLPAYRRRVNTVFQQYALFPHLSVFENVAYGLRVRKLPGPEIRARAEEALSMVKMSEFARRAPAQLSGGQKQRVALARALVNRPMALLLDEPLSALDANLRRQMQMELKTLQREVGITFLYVTHDQEEAMVLSDRIALLRAGQLEQVASPREIYNHPLTAYTARFIGQTNLLRCRAQGGVVRWGIFCWRAEGLDGPATFSLRPESIRFIANPGEAAPNTAVRFRATIQRQTFGGATDLLELACAGECLLQARVPSRGSLEGDWEFEFSPADAVRVLDTEHN